MNEWCKRCDCWRAWTYPTATTHYGYTSDNPHLLSRKGATHFGLSQIIPADEIWMNKSSTITTEIQIRILNTPPIDCYWVMYIVLHPCLSWVNNSDTPQTLSSVQLLENRFIIRYCLTSIAIPIIKIRRSYNQLAIIMAIPYTERASLYWKRCPAHCVLPAGPLGLPLFFGGLALLLQGGSLLVFISQLLPFLKVITATNGIKHSEKIP